MEHRMDLKRINILIMPTDACNLRCSYCFHECFHMSNERMEIKTLDRIYDITYASCPEVHFVWHGGEPLLMGIDFFDYALKKQKEYNWTKISNTMQSNLTLMTDELADLLCSNDVGIGTSFDGVLNENLRGNTQRILEGRELVLSKGANCGVIMVVSAKNISTLIDSYSMFKDKNINYNMNTYVSRGLACDADYELTPDNAIKHFIDFFEFWINDEQCNIHVYLFERILQFIASGKKNVCKYTSCVGRWIGIRFDGTIVPCNRYFPEEYSFGNIWDYNSISDAFESPGAIKLIEKAIERRKKCRSCIAYGLCEGGCNNVAYNEGGIENNGGRTCVIFKNVFEYINDYIFSHEVYEILNPMARKVLRFRNKHLGKQQ